MPVFSERQHIPNHRLQMHLVDDKRLARLKFFGVVNFWTASDLAALIKIWHPVFGSAKRTKTK
jgi:hypothetical protein